jgi:ribosomal protein S18 acetylase RimI-like enzyme
MVQKIPGGNDEDSASLVGLIQTLRVRRAVEGEESALSALAEKLFRQGYGATHPEPELSRYISRTFSEEAFGSILHDQDSVVLIAEDAARALAGYAILRDTDEERIEILRFYVDEKWHGSGAAQLLMRECIREARKRKKETVWLQTWQQSGRAIAFYRKMGFVVSGTTTFQFGDRIDDDYLLVRPVAGGDI